MMRWEKRGWAIAYVALLLFVLRWNERVERLPTHTFGTRNARGGPFVIVQIRINLNVLLCSRLVHV